MDGTTTKLKKEIGHVLNEKLIPGCSCSAIEEEQVPGPEVKEFASQVLTALRSDNSGTKGAEPDPYADLYEHDERQHEDLVRRISYQSAGFKEKEETLETEEGYLESE